MSTRPDVGIAEIPYAAGRVGGERDRLRTGGQRGWSLLGEGWFASNQLRNSDSWMDRAETASWRACAMVRAANVAFVWSRGAGYGRGRARCERGPWSSPEPARRSTYCKESLRVRAARRATKSTCARASDFARTDFQHRDCARLDMAGVCCLGALRRWPCVRVEWCESRPSSWWEDFVALSAGTIGDRIADGTPARGRALSDT